MIRSLINSFARRTGKYRSFELDASMTGRTMLELVWHLAVWSLRGFVMRLRLGSARGFVLCGTGVRVRYPSFVTSGRGLVLEDYCEIVAWSSEGIRLGSGVTIGAFSTIKPSSYYGRSPGVGLSVGDRSNIGRYSYIGCSGRITIGNDVMMAPGVSLFAEQHVFDRTDVPMKQQGVVRDEIVIEDDCWIASRAVILAGVTIGRGSVVASGAVVSKDVPPFSVVVGVPARVITNRVAATG